MGTGPIQVRRLRTVSELRARLAELGVAVPADAEVAAAGPLAEPLDAGRVGRLANRWAILPMEGWDATIDGRPTDLVRRRWGRFGASGAALVWGGEAVAVVPEGRANPRQLCIGPHAVGDLSGLRAGLVDAHRQARGTIDGLVVGLQLTHSGRWSRPEGRPAPRVAYRHPVLDQRVGVTEADVLSDAELDDLIGAFVAAARVAAEAGFDFVDLKQCHGYLGHELLSGVDRPGPYGGDLAGRSRFVLAVAAEVRAAVPGLALGTRLSAFDGVPFVAGPDGAGVPDPVATLPYRFAFGGGIDGEGIDLAEPHVLVDRLQAAGVDLLCVTAGSPYANPHRQRPAYFPPSDGYLPPRDPLVDVAVLVAATAELTRAHPGITVVGSGLTYLQEWLPHVAQALVRDGWMDVAGLGRMVLSYPTLPADVLAGRALSRSQLCRTFSDCTTAPRHGLVSGCYPLDEEYRQRPERVELIRVKRDAPARRGRRRA